MPITNTSRTAGPFIGNGVTKDFPFSYKVFSRQDVLVAVTDSSGTETIKTLDADYTVELNQNQDANPGGIIHMVVAPPTGSSLAATSNLSLVQTLDLTNLGGFYPRTITDALDRMMINIQQLAARVGLGLNVGAAAQIQTVINFIATLAAGSGAAAIGFLQSGVGAVVRTLQSKNREWVTPEDFGAVGNNVADDTLAIQKALNASFRVMLGDATYKTTAPLTATINHEIIGRGFSRSIINAAHNAGAIVVPAPTTDSYASMNFSKFRINAKNGINIGGTRDTHAADGAIIGGHINVQVFGTYGSGSGDAAYSTSNVRNSANALVPILTTNDIDVQKTFFDVSSYGVGLYMCKCFDTVIESPQFYGNGVAVALIGCDIITWRGGRAHEPGWFLYEERVSTTGSQVELSHVDLLHNRRAGGLASRDTKYLRVHHCYYECYANSAALWLATGTEGLSIKDNRIDDPYGAIGTTPANGTTPIGVFYFPRWNNIVEGNLFQKFTDFSLQTPPVRVVSGSALCDSNHPETVALINSTGQTPMRFSAPSAGCRFGPLIRNLYTPSNIPDRVGGNFTPLSVADGATNIFNNGASIFPTVRFNVSQTAIQQSFQATAKSISGSTTVFFSIEQRAADGSLKATLFSAPLDGFTPGTYATVSKALTLTSPADGDYVIVTWQANAGNIAALSLSPIVPPVPTTP